MSELGVEKGLKGSEENLDEGTENEGYTVSKKQHRMSLKCSQTLWMKRNAYDHYV